MLAGVVTVRYAHVQCSSFCGFLRGARPGALYRLLVLDELLIQFPYFLVQAATRAAAA